MRKIFVLLIALVIVLMVAGPVFAQDIPPFPTNLPGTAAEGVDVVAVFLAALTGLLATTVTDAFKNLPVFNRGEKQKIADAYASLVSIVASVLAGYGVGYLAVLAGILDESGLWQLLLYTWPAAKGWFETSSIRRNIVKKDDLPSVKVFHAQR